MGLMKKEIILLKTNLNKNPSNFENKKISVRTFYLPFFICTIIFLTHLLNIDSRELFGLRPQKIDSIISIFLVPFAHSDFNHLINNLIPLFFLISVLIHFYESFSYKLLFLMYFFTGFGMWFFCPLNHNIIGASGVLYCLSSFLFFSGIFKKNRQLMAISLIIVFLYGGMFWGIFDMPHNSLNNISWESHRIGFSIGLLFSYIFKSKGPKKIEFKWDDEEFNDDDDIDGDYTTSNDRSGEDIEYKYSIKK